MFSALRQGALVYILDKAETPSIKIGQVESVTQPRPKYNTFNPTAPFGSNMETVVDITVKVDNEKKDYIGIPSNASIHGYGNIVISENREAMAAEVNNMLQTSKQALDSIDYHKKVISTCEEMLKQLDPDYAKQQERDNAIDSLKTEVGSLKSDMSRILDLLTKAKTDQS